MSRWLCDTTTHTNWNQLADHERLAIMSQHPEYTDADMKRGHWKMAVDSSQVTMPAPDSLLEEVSGTMVVDTDCSAPFPELHDIEAAEYIPPSTPYTPTAEEAAAAIITETQLSDDYKAWVAEALANIAALPAEPLLAQRVHPDVRRSGLWLEFGVGSGASLRTMARERGEARVIGFDSFEGLPEAWRPGYPKGMFACEPPTLDGAELVIGRFEESLPFFTPTEPFTFVHIDSDIYSSASAVLGG